MRGFDSPSICCIQALEFSGAKPPPPPTTARPHSAPLSAGRLLRHAAEADDGDDDNDDGEAADVDRRGTVERQQLRAGAAAAGRLLRTLSEGYRLLSVYQCREAVDVLRTLPAGQYNTGCAPGTDARHMCAGCKCGIGHAHLPRHGSSRFWTKSPVASGPPRLA